MLKFTPKSRYIDDKAIKEYYNTDLKLDELLVCVPIDIERQSQNEDKR
ncbi:hypothetical protein FNE32_04200 [Helicobacter pylori]|nr:hypothetical protein FNE32_04200 [Helicobacter pylori]